MYQYVLTIRGVNYASLMDDRWTGALLEAVARTLGATVLEPVQGILCLQGVRWLAGMSPAGSLRLLYIPSPEQKCFTLDIRSEQPCDMGPVVHLLTHLLTEQDSGGQLIYPRPLPAKH